MLAPFWEDVHLAEDAWFDSSPPHRPDGFGQGDIWIATRESTEVDFGAAMNLGETINNRYHDGSPTLSADGLTLYFESQRPDGRVGGTDLWMASRDRPDMPWNAPVNLGETINSRGHDLSPALSPDGLRLFFSSDRSGSYDIWMSTRATPSDPWNNPVQLDENVNHSTNMEVAPALSPDGSTLYLSANRSSSPYVLSWDIYEVPILSDTQTGPMLLPGDANQDLDFDQLDLVRVQVTAKYLTGRPTTWGEGDWDGAPGGSQGHPPADDGHFNQFDIIAAQQGATYLTGPYASIVAGGKRGDGQASVIYDPSTGEVAVDAPSGVELTSINIDSTSGIFTGAAAQKLGGSFDNDADNNIFKATFGGSFGSLSFDNVAQTGLPEEFVLGDLTVIGSLAGGGELGNVDLVYVPEPTSSLLLSVGLAIGLLHFRRLGR